MTEREQFNLDETRMRVGYRDGWRCVYCGCDDPMKLQLAHRIPKDKRYIRQYGKRVIHHWKNLTMTCDECNYKAEIDPKTRPLTADRLINKIRSAIAEEDNNGK